MSRFGSYAEGQRILSLGCIGFRLVQPGKIVVPITHMSPGDKAHRSGGGKQCRQRLHSFRAYQTCRRRYPVDRVYPNLNSGKAPSRTRIVGVICHLENIWQEEVETQDQHSRGTKARTGD